MKTVKIYTYDITEATSIHEQGNGISLAPWGNDTSHIKGNDDGGKDYMLPSDFEVANDTSGQLQIYDNNGEYCELTLRDGKPTLITLGGIISLRAAQ